MSKYLVLDLETSISEGWHGSLPKDPSNDFYSFIFGTHPAHVSVIHKLKGFGRQVPKEYAAVLKKCEYLIGLNLGFDIGYVWHTPETQEYIKNRGKIWDCSVAEYILTGQQHKYASLKELQGKYLGEATKEPRISVLYASGTGADKIIAAKERCPRTWSLYEKYCYLDGQTTLQVFEKQYKRAKEEGMLEIIQLYNDYLLALINMEATGIHVDLEGCEKLCIEFQQKYIEHLEAAQNILASKWNDPDLPEFNINSPQHKSLILFGGSIDVRVKEQVGHFQNGKPRYKSVSKTINIEGFNLPKELTRLTRIAGRYATDVTVIKNIANAVVPKEVKEYCEHQTEAMAYKKAQKTYVEAFMKYSVSGKLYPHYNNTAVATGRLSSSAPNLQNVSKRNKFGKLLHNLFVAPEGWVCAQFDFSQLEIWVSAWLSGDWKLTHDLEAGTDLHIVRMQYYNPDYTYEQLVDLCKVQQDEYWMQQRTAAKTVSYQMAYGAMPKKVAESTGLDIEVVKQIYEKEAITYPDSFGLGEIVAATAESSKQISKAQDIPTEMKKGINGCKIKGNVELLPIFDIDKTVRYNESMLRYYGEWRSPTGKKCRFLDVGRITKHGKIRRGFEKPQFKNYPMQSTAADIQGATSYECMLLCVNNPDKIRMINEIHDSKWFYIKEEYLEEMVTRVKAIMENIPALFRDRFNIDVPFQFPVEVEIGKTFGEMEKYK